MSANVMSLGAVDFVTKPAGEVSVDLSKIADDLIAKLTAAAASRPRAASAVAPMRASGSLGLSGKTPLPLGAPRLCVVAISTGGPAAVRGS